MFVLGKIGTLLLLPTALLVECAGVGLLLSRWRLGRALLVLGVAGLAACLVLPVESWAVRPLEDRFPRVTAFPDRVDGIVVLGGAIDDLTSRDRDTPVLNWAANRMTDFVALARRYPQARLVFTGGSGAIEQGVSTEAEFAKPLFEGLGLPPDRMVFEGASRTTRENATLTYALMQPKPGERWILITSASHMPRSIGVFRKAGWDILPWPVGYQTRTHVTGYTTLGWRLEVLDWGVHEWLGLAAYYAIGWTDALFPGPSQR